MKYRYEFRRISGMNGMPDYMANRETLCAFSKARNEYGKAPYSTEKVWSDDQISRVNALLKRGWQSSLSSFFLFFLHLPQNH